MSYLVFYYFRLARPLHIIFDLAIAVAAAYFIVDYNYVVTAGKAVPNLLDWARILIPALTFQAGLHTTSLSFFANSSSPLLKRLREEFIGAKQGKPTKYAKIHQIYAYFSWAILVQLTVLLANVAGTFYLTSNDVKLIPIVNIMAFYYLIVFGSLYAVLLSLRNVGILFMTLTANSKPSTPTT